ncbi:MAG: pSer/pThr/pTyr-binding forkhead associated (FHA) protein [Pirellulaceae bacterium]
MILYEVQAGVVVSYFVFFDHRLLGQTPQGSSIMYGELIPLGGGDPIPLLKSDLLVGRRESCDIVLRFANVSAHHCQLTLENGYWFVKDKNSRNGTKVNGNPITRKRVNPGDTLAVAKHKYEVHYSPADLGAVGSPPPDESNLEEILRSSLLERAGLAQQPKNDNKRSGQRYNPLDDSANQIKDPNKPV